MKLAWLLWMTSLFPQHAADQTCLATTIYLEARSEPVRGQLAVAEVALRRREQGRWGNTLCGVLTAPGQFALSTVGGGFVLDSGAAWLRAWTIAGLSMTMWHLPESLRLAVVPRADHFYAHGSAAPNWAQGQPLAVIGDHQFYSVN